MMHKATVPLRREPSVKALAEAIGEVHMGIVTIQDGKLSLKLYSSIALDGAVLRLVGRGLVDEAELEKTAPNTYSYIRATPKESVESQREAIAATAGGDCKEVVEGKN